MATINGNAGSNTLRGTASDDRIYGYAGNDFLYGYAGHDLLDGGTGNDALDGGSGSDTMRGQTGNDTLAGGSGHDWLEGGDGNDALAGGNDNDTLNGGYGNDVLLGQAGDDWLNGGQGINQLAGGTGNDVYVVNTHYDVVTELQGAGYDTIRTSLAAYTLEPNLERLIFTGQGSFLANGNNLQDRMEGGGSGDTLRGFSGNDTLYGFGGDDILDGEQHNDRLDGGVGNDELNGGHGYDTLVGGDGDDVLDGGSENDVMQGGLGRDTYYVDSAADAVIEGASQGHDAVWVSLSSYVLPTGVEDLFSHEPEWPSDYDPWGVVLTGNSGSNEIVGDNNLAIDKLYGLAGDDSLSGLSGSDELYGGAGNDILSGGLGNDVLQGDNGADVLDGSVGSDRFVYNSKNDSSLSLQDIITSFQSAIDLLDLSGIDANANQLGNQAFVLTEGPAACSVWQYHNEQTGQLVIAGDVTGNGTADFVINIAQVVNGGAELATADILL